MKIIQTAILLYLISFQLVAFCMQVSDGTQVGHYITSNKIVCFEGDKKVFEEVLAYNELKDYFKNTVITESVTGEQVSGTVSNPQFFFNLEKVMGPKFVLSNEEKVIAVIYAALFYQRALPGLLSLKETYTQDDTQLKKLVMQAQTNRSKAFYAALFLMGSIAAVSFYRHFGPYLQEPFDTIFYLAPLVPFASVVYTGKRVLDWVESLHFQKQKKDNIDFETKERPFKIGEEIRKDIVRIFDNNLPKYYKKSGEFIYNMWKEKYQAVNR